MKTLSLRLLEHANALHSSREVVSRRPDKSLHRCNYAAVYKRSRQLAQALARAGIQRGDAGSYPQSALENLRGIVAAEVQVAQRGKQLRIGAEIEYHRGVDPVRAVGPR